MKKFIQVLTAIFSFIIFLFLLYLPLPVEAQQHAETRKQDPVFDRWDPTDSNMKTGPAVGESIPDFEAADQNGKSTSFQDIVGPKGAVILFYRSADW